MNSQAFDYVVLGGGPAALGEAIRLNGQKARSAVVGDCFGGCMAMMGCLHLQSYVDELEIEGAPEDIRLFVQSKPICNPTGYEYARYVADNLAALGLRTIRSTVLGVARKADGFVIELVDEAGLGRAIRARTVVFATGLRPRPNPDCPQQVPVKSCFAVYEDLTKGDCSPYLGRDVVVIGSGNSAFQLAFELAACAGSVTILANQYSGIFPQETCERFALRANSQRAIEVIAKTARADAIGPLNKHGRRALAPIWLHVYRTIRWLPAPGLLLALVHPDDNASVLLSGSLAHAVQVGRASRPDPGSQDCGVRIDRANAVVVSAIGVVARVPDTSWSGMVDPVSGFVTHSNGRTGIDGVLVAGGCAGYPSVNTMRPALSFGDGGGRAATQRRPSAQSLAL
jgi:thioredoxin reductase